jgi:phage terminase large subunit-like protein
MQTRNDAMQKQKQSKSDSFGAIDLPPTLCSVVSETNQPELAVTGSISTDQPLTGRTLPRLETLVTGAGSYGPQVAQWARDHLGMELMDWQVHALSGQLAHDDVGDLVHRESCCSTGRQQGKTLAFSALCGWWLTTEATRRGEPQTVLSAAHKLDRASAVFLLLAPILEAKFGAKIGWSYGRQSATMPDGSRWEVRAATPQNAHGGSVDLAILDEIWSIPATVIFDAVRPSQIARKSPLLSMWSTAGDESSTAFLLLREQGINAIDAGVQRQLYFAEWSPPPGVNIDDQQWWAWSNPALGKTIQMSALVAASQSPDRASWLRAHLNLWVAAAQGWMPVGIWDQRKVEGIADLFYFQLA